MKNILVGFITISSKTLFAGILIMKFIDVNSVMDLLPSTFSDMVNSNNTSGTSVSVSSVIDRSNSELNSLVFGKVITKN